MSRHVSSKDSNKPLGVWPRATDRDSKVNILVMFNLSDTFNKHFLLGRNRTWSQRHFMIHWNFESLLSNVDKVVQGTESTFLSGEIVTIALKHFVQYRTADICASSFDSLLNLHLYLIEWSAKCVLIPNRRI